MVINGRVAKRKRLTAKIRGRVGRRLFEGRRMKSREGKRYSREGKGYSREGEGYSREGKKVFGRGEGLFEVLEEGVEGEFFGLPVKVGLGEKAVIRKGL